MGSYFPEPVCNTGKAELYVYSDEVGRLVGIVKVEVCTGNPVKIEIISNG